MARIIIDARESGTTTGRYVDKLIEYLHELNPEHEILILTKTPRLDYIKSISPKFTVLKSDYQEFTFSEQLGFLKQLRQLKPDLVHFTMTQQPILYRGRSVTTIHDLITARFRNPAKNWLVFRFKQQVYKYVIKKVARKSAYIITPSEFVKHDVAQYAKVPASKIIVTHEAADKISQEAKPIKTLVGKKFLLYTGRPLPHKNLRRLIKAFMIIKHSHSNLYLVLVGKTDVNYEKLKAYSQKVGAKDVVFTNFVTEGELRWLYENTQAYVIPSLSEGFNLPGLEAMMHGAPVISSKATCLPEVYQDGAIYFDPLDVNDMAAKISHVLDEPKQRQELIQKGQKVAAQYSWKRMTEQTLRLYQKALRS